MVVMMLYPLAQSDFPFLSPLLLFSPWVFPVCSPNLLQKVSQPAGPDFESMLGGDQGERRSHCIQLRPLAAPKTPRDVVHDDITRVMPHMRSAPLNLRRKLTPLETGIYILAALGTLHTHTTVLRINWVKPQLSKVV